LVVPARNSATVKPRERLAGLPLALIPRLSVVVASCSSTIGAISFQLVVFDDDLAHVRPAFEAPIGRFEIKVESSRSRRKNPLMVQIRTNALSGPGWLETRGLAQSALNPIFQIRKIIRSDA
jgi:hypothetical protein